MNKVLLNKAARIAYAKAIVVAEDAKDAADKAATDAYDKAINAAHAEYFESKIVEVTSE